MSVALPLSENDGAQDGDENQERSELEGVDEILEEQIGERFGGRGRAILRGGLHCVLRARDGGSEKAGQCDGQRDTGPARELREIGALFDSGIQQHDYEDEQHHDGAAIDDDLHRRDEFRAHQKIETGERDHDHDERERAVNGMALEDKTNRANYTHGREDEENNQRRVHFGLLQRIAEAVSTTLARETGRSNFQPKAMSWS